MHYHSFEAILELKNALAQREFLGERKRGDGERIESKHQVDEAVLGTEPKARELGFSTFLSYLLWIFYFSLQPILYRLNELSIWFALGDLSSVFRHCVLVKWILLFVLLSLPLFL